MLYIIAIILLVGLLYLPQLWVSWVLERYNRSDEDNFPGTGGEFARHLLDRYELQDVKVESTRHGDHYDPTRRAVCLTQDKFDSKTLTAITVAAHECGHAFQHANQDPMFHLRTRIAVIAHHSQKLGSLLLFLVPILTIFSRSPAIAFINITGVILLVGMSVILHLITLPVELDASFKRALPELSRGYLSNRQMGPARQILKAAAWTYVAGALSSLLNFWRWMSVLRR